MRLQTLLPLLTYLLDPPTLRSVTIFWFITCDCPPALVTACRTLVLGPIVSSGWMEPGSMSGAVHI